MIPAGTTDRDGEVSYTSNVLPKHGAPMNLAATRPPAFPRGAYWFRPDGKRFRLRVVVGRLATLKVDQASIAEAQFALAA
jgi:hypothetical protein